MKLPGLVNCDHLTNQISCSLYLISQFEFEELASSPLPYCDCAGEHTHPHITMTRSEARGALLFLFFFFTIIESSKFKAEIKSIQAFWLTTMTRSEAKGALLVLFIYNYYKFTLLNYIIASLHYHHMELKTMGVKLTHNNDKIRDKRGACCYFLSIFTQPWRGQVCKLRFWEFSSECDIRMVIDTNEYPNIFVSRKWHERISECVRMKFLTQTNIRIYSYQNFDTNEYLNKYLDRKYSNILIYLSHSGLDWHQFCAFTI